MTTPTQGLVKHFHTYPGGCNTLAYSTIHGTSLIVTSAEPIKRIWPIERDSLISPSPLIRLRRPALWVTSAILYSPAIDTHIEGRISIAFLSSYISASRPAVCNSSSFSLLPTQESLIQWFQTKSFKGFPTTTFHSYELHDNYVETPTHPSTTTPT